jgi:hypothetical protein
MPKQTWSTVKSAASKLSQQELLGLVGELYRLSRQSKDFLHARFGDQSVAMEEYKSIIIEYLYPDVSRDRPLQVAKAKQAVADFCKSTADPVAHAELMVFFVEQGNAFTLDYSDIDAGFYSALLKMARRAVEVISRVPLELQESFRERLAEVVRSSSGIGWGYHDELADIYGGAFPDRT